MTNVIPFVPRIVESAEMPKVEKIDWATAEPIFSFSQEEPGGFAKIEGLIPLEIALLMSRGLEAFITKRSATAKTKRTADKKRRPN